MTQKTEAELLLEQLKKGPPSAEEAKRYYDDRMNNEPPLGADADGNVTLYASASEAKEALAKWTFTFINEDDPADISDIDDWDDI